MRAAFGVLSLVVVLAIVGLVAKKQLQAVSTVGTPAGVALPASAANATAPEQSRMIQQQVQQDVTRVLEQGAARASEPQP